jgi:hypothetical protein
MKTKKVHAVVKSYDFGSFVPCPLGGKEIQRKVSYTRGKVTCEWCKGYIAGRIGAENNANNSHDIEPRFMVARSKY